MAHCPLALLDDVSAVIDEVRSWPGVVERNPGVFYLGREPFLHFHLLEGRRRRADVKGRAAWTQVDLPRPFSAARRRRLLGVLDAAYREKRGRRP